MISTRKGSNELDESFGNMGSSLFGWVKDTVGNKGSSLLNKVAEKAKSSVGSVITTLDPQMKDFMCKNFLIFSTIRIFHISFK